MGMWPSLSTALKTAPHCQLFSSVSFQHKYLSTFHPCASHLQSQGPITAASCKGGGGGHGQAAVSEGASSEPEASRAWPVLTQMGQQPLPCLVEPACTALRLP